LLLLRTFGCVEKQKLASKLTLNWLSAEVRAEQMVSLYSFLLYDSGNTTES